MLDDILYGGLVLSTSLPPYVPFFPVDYTPTQHIHGSPYGTVYNRATRSFDFYVPQKGSRKYSVYANENVSADFGRSMAESLLPDKTEPVTFNDKVRSDFYQRCPDSGLLVIEQSSPYGVIVFQSKGIELSMYGLYNGKEAILVWTNSDIIESQLTKAYGDRYLIYRFLPRSFFASVIMTARVCSRWYRWGKIKDLYSYGPRFAVLERSLVYDQPFS